MDRDAVLVTGGNSGIGFECARQLARAGWYVLIASRNRDLSAEAVRRIGRESGGDAVSEMGLDLGSTESVRRFAKEIEALDVQLRALVCNAGLQVSRGLQLSRDGFELTFAVNHLGHFLLTNLLLARLLANAPARVVIVASGVHDPKLRTGMPKPSITDLETLAATGGPRRGDFDGRLAYVNSKLCNLWFAYELGRRIDGAGLSNDRHRLTVNAFDPGLVPGSGWRATIRPFCASPGIGFFPGSHGCSRPWSPPSTRHRRRGTRSPGWCSTLRSRAPRESTFHRTPAGGKRRPRTLPTIWNERTPSGRRAPG
jgi:NAD(P)-dependent dehydrogenase (short-subunit alcohol dehydrogenase family)